MGSPLLQVAWEQCLLEPARDRAAEAYLRREAGSAPAWTRYFLAAPWLAKAMIRLAVDNGLLVCLDFATADLVALAVSQENSCRYCYAATRAQLRLLGMSEERIQRLEQQLARTELEPRAAAAVRYARRFARANPLATPRDLAPLRAAGFGDEEVREIAYVAASVDFFNRISTISALPPQGFEQAPDRWFVRWFQPLVARVVRGWRRRGQAVPPAPPPPGPCAELVRRYAGSPVAPALAEVLHDLWTSALLPRRCKALMFAVVGRGLGCRYSTLQACGMLRDEGMEDEAVDYVLAHLGGPQLDATESQLLAFARETIWYEPMKIQRRARTLREHVGTAPFVEAVGTVALANALCRLGDALIEPE